MNSFVAVMKNVAEQEVQKQHQLELGVVTSVFPHASGSDKDNYQCSVKLKNRKQPDGSDFELRKVPIATQHIGLANIPNVGDLVVIGYLEGSLNSPIVLGRFYNDEDIPPENDVGQLILTQLESITITTNAGTKIEVDGDGNVNIESVGDVIINDGSKGAARKDDDVEVTIPSGTFITSVSGGGGAPAVGVPNPAPVKVQGKITAASGTVKIGD